MNWRTLGDVPLSAYEAEFRRFNSPMLPYADIIWGAAHPHSALCLGMMFVEQKYHTLSSIPEHYLNPLSQTRSQAEQADGKGRWKRFDTYAEAVLYWKDRLTSPTGPYKDTVTLLDLINVYAPAYDNNNPQESVNQVLGIIGKYKTIDEGETPLPAPAQRPKILLTRGHGTTGDTGAFAGGQSEEAHNKRIVPAIAKTLRDNGWDVTTFPDPAHNEVPGTLDTEGAYARDWMSALKGAPGVMLDCHLESSSARGIFAIVPNLAHLVTGAAAKQNPNDQWANNVGDRALGLAICKAINAHTGIPIREQWVREPGLMSEDMTWVGQGGGGAYMPSRLAMFGYTSPYCSHVYRLVVEFANLQHDAQYYTRQDFPERCATGVLAALNQVFGATKPEAPVEVAYPVEPVPENVRHALHGTIIREKPTTTSRVKTSYKKRTAVRIVAVAKNGEDIHDSDVWFQIRSKGPSNKGFVHASGLERVESV